MPGQKNSGNKGRKRETGVAVRHRRFIADLINDYRADGKVDDIYIGRVVRKLGNGRVDVFYVATEKENTFDKNGNEVVKEVSRSYEKQAVIRGSFRGKGKHSVWVEQGGIVVVADTGVGVLEIMGVLSQDELNVISKSSYVDERILTPASSGDGENDLNRIEFGNDSEDEKLSDDDIDNI